jgi:hypothetical protein
VALEPFEALQRAQRVEPVVEDGDLHRAMRPSLVWSGSD